MGDDNQSHNNETASNTDNNNLSKVLFVCFYTAYRSRKQSYINELRAFMTEFMLDAHGTAVHNTPIIAQLCWVLYNSGVMLQTYVRMKECHMNDYNFT